MSVHGLDTSPRNNQARAVVEDSEDYTHISTSTYAGSEGLLELLILTSRLITV